MINTYMFYFPAHDEDKLILLGLIRAKHEWIADHRFAPHCIISFDEKAGCIVAECERLRGMDIARQGEFLGAMGRAFWQLAQLQCMEVETL